MQRTRQIFYYLLKEYVICSNFLLLAQIVCNFIKQFGICKHFANYLQRVCVEFAQLFGALQTICKIFANSLISFSVVQTREEARPIIQATRAGRPPSGIGTGKTERINRSTGVGGAPTKWGTTVTRQSQLRPNGVERVLASSTEGSPAPLRTQTIALLLC